MKLIHCDICGKIPAVELVTKYGWDDYYVDLCLYCLADMYRDITAHTPEDRLRDHLSARAALVKAKKCLNTDQNT